MCGVTYTLLLPWIDHAKSYEYVYMRLADKLVPVWRAEDCMTSVGLGESEAPTLRYYTQIRHQPIEVKPKTECRRLIAQNDSTLPSGKWTPF